jgi:hypothetical protein
VCETPVAIPTPSAVSPTATHPFNTSAETARITANVLFMHPSFSPAARIHVNGITKL